jgi:hypothetical protein
MMLATVNESQRELVPACTIEDKGYAEQARSLLRPAVVRGTDTRFLGASGLAPLRNRRRYGMA